MAISSSLPKVAQSKSGHFGVQHVMQVTLTCDHRHIYGAHAAEFLRDLADLLENRVEDLLMGSSKRKVESKKKREMRG